MAKKAKSGNSTLSLICFILFIVWAIAQLLSAFDLDSDLLDAVTQLANIAALVCMAFFAFTYYSANKKNIPIAVMFWIAVAVGVVAVVLPMLGIL